MIIIIIIINYDDNDDRNENINRETYHDNFNSKTVN